MSADEEPLYCRTCGLEIGVTPGCLCPEGDPTTPPVFCELCGGTLATGEYLCAPCDQALEAQANRAKPEAPERKPF